MSFSSFPSLFFFRVHATLVRAGDFILSLLFYGRYPRFLLSYLLMSGLYLLRNPYRTSLRFHREKKSQPYQFGTTPLLTLDRIATRAQILSDDIVVELGCGTGHTLLWLSQVIGCRAIGIEWVPQFVENFQWIQKKCLLKNVEIKQQNYLETDLSNASVLYLYGTCMEDSEIEEFCKQIPKLKEGCRLVTVSFPLSAYTDDPRLQEVDSFLVHFPWGKTEAYVQRVTSI
jgi:SAM-dependent methyltransferase